MSKAVSLQLDLEKLPKVFNITLKCYKKCYKSARSSKGHDLKI